MRYVKRLRNKFICWVGWVLGIDTPDWYYKWEFINEHDE